jgi:hypothetical protein
MAAKILESYSGVWTLLDDHYGVPRLYGRSAD